MTERIREQGSLAVRVVLVVALALVLGAVAWAGSRTGDEAAAPPPRSVPASVFFTRGDPGAGCRRVFTRQRDVLAPGVLRGTLTKLLHGPTATERRLGYGGWFSARTAGKLRSVRIAVGVAYVDFHDLRPLIPNASTSCGSALLLAQLDRTAKQFPSVRRVVYSIESSRRTIYEWLQLPTPRT
jgi:hypothetical protein